MAKYKLEAAENVWNLAEVKNKYTLCEIEASSPPVLTVTCDSVIITCDSTLILCDAA
jgi:hypothetical protein